MERAALATYMMVQFAANQPMFKDMASEFFGSPIDSRHVSIHVAGSSAQGAGGPPPIHPSRIPDNSAGNVSTGTTTSIPEETSIGSDTLAQLKAGAVRDDDAPSTLKVQLGESANASAAAVVQGAIQGDLSRMSPPYTLLPGRPAPASSPLGQSIDIRA